MKVLHVLYSGLGGHGSVFFSMVNADLDRFFKYEAVFNGIEDIREEYVQRCTAKNIPYTFIKKQPGKHLIFFFRLFQAMRKAKPDIIFLHGSMAVSSAFAASFFFGKQKIFIRETQALHLKTGLEKMTFKMGMLLADRVVFLSHEYQQEVKKNLGAFYRPKKISVIPNGIDLSFFFPQLNKTQSDNVVLGMQSRLVAIKDHITLFNALAIIKNKLPNRYFQLFIAGDGDYRLYLEQMVDKSGLRKYITFLGVLNEDKLPQFLQSLDIYIHASFGETMSTAIMQAMACGLPIIASDVDGINNMVEHKQTGILVPVKNEQAMADAIIELSENTVLQKQLSQQALLYARDHFSNRRMFERYKSIFLYPTI